MFSLQQNWRTRGRNRFFPKAGGWGANDVYTLLSKYKSNKKRSVSFNIPSVASLFTC
jgi:hypothetical protein